MNSGYAAASRADTRAIEARAAAGSSWKNTAVPSATVAQAGSSGMGS
jgi:hypothetical protein